MRQLRDASCSQLSILVLHVVDNARFLVPNLLLRVVERRGNSLVTADGGTACISKEAVVATAAWSDRIQVAVLVEMRCGAIFSCCRNVS